MSNDKHDAAYHPGQAFVDGKIVNVDGQEVPMPTEPGKYGAFLDTTNGKVRMIKIAEVEIRPKAHSFAQIMGAIIGAVVVCVPIIIGFRFLVLWLWGI